MASIFKRKNKYCVVYKYIDAKGNERQKWETFDSNAEAKKRKNEIEYQKDKNTFVVPEAKTVSDLLRDYVSIYGVNSWAMSTYESRISLIRNYIEPIIGDMDLSKVSIRVIEQYYQSLLKVNAVSSNNRKARTEFVTASTVRHIHQLLRSAFNQAVKWELMSKNPCVNATVPKAEHKKREIWDADTLFKAIELCDDDIIKLALNLAFCCSLRMGEMLGLTWDCVDISEESIQNGNSYVYVNKELQRVNIDSFEKLDAKDVIFKFPAVLYRKTTMLVLKSPKTVSSIRRVYLPQTVARMLQDRKKTIEELKELFGDEYTDFDLVFSNPNGHPIEGQVINRGLNKLIKDHDLPPVVFHSLRHSSITYKLKINGGDIKSVQGDSGHAQTKMISDVYSHILDEDRKVNAQRFEQAFYSKTTENLADNVEKDNAVSTTDEDDLQTLLRLLQKPGLADVLKSLMRG